MNQRDTFLKRLAENENDSSTRMDYADWLDDQGEYDEADRQRAWPAAKAWLVRFCKEHSGWEPFQYDELIEFGRRVAHEQWVKGLPDRVSVNSRDMWRALSNNSNEFWNNWSVVTGLAIPSGLDDKDFHHWVCCAHEVYYWFGLPDAEDETDDGKSY